jgi:hypothetical protein
MEIDLSSLEAPFLVRALKCTCGCTAEGRDCEGGNSPVSDVSNREANRATMQQFLVKKTYFVVALGVVDEVEV